MTRVGWFDCSFGVSGDMLLAAIADAGCEVSVMSAAVESLGLDLSLRISRVTRGGLAAAKVDVVGADQPSQPSRGLREVIALLGPLPDPVRTRAETVFGTLAHAEAAVHGCGIDEVHFHEVGALDAIADIVGVCTGLSYLNLDEIHSSPLCVGGGSVSTAHGDLSVPVPAVVELLRLAAAPSQGRSGAGELTTPTGAALLATFAHSWGHQPPMVITSVGVGAGSRETHGWPNVTRLLIGDSARNPIGAETDRVLIEATVDDAEPRLWPHVISLLLAAGADDAWVTPTVGKKGRPGIVLTALCARQRADEIAAIIFTETPTLGLRRMPVEQRDVLERDFLVVDIDGHEVRVKRGWLHGRAVTLQPEWDDVVSAATALGRPAKSVVEQARRRAGLLVD